MQGPGAVPVNHDSTLKHSTDIIVIGSGFSGSIMALVLSSIGYRVTVVDQCKHPRFAIGESSTPMADSFLKEISETFSIPELLPLVTFSSARKAYPDLTIGKKRGFSYFWHQRGKEFDAGDNHENEMVVAANSSDELSDSHWMRSEIDEFFVSLFQKYDINFFDECSVQNISRINDHWLLSCDRSSTLAEPSKQLLIDADFLIDASGAFGVVLKQLGIPRRTSELSTNTSVLYAHFEGMLRWKDLVDPLSAKDHPFICDDAAVHHVFDFGWMWQLRFENGVTSCGFSIPASSENKIGNDFSDGKSMDSFYTIINNYPTLKKQFSNANCVSPITGPVSRSRIQYLADAGSGLGWCALPNTVGFIDPLHSKGIAHSLSGIVRLGKLFRKRTPLNDEALNVACHRLAEQFRKEVRFIDRIVSICYQSLFDFRLFRLATFWYFAAVTNFEKNRSNNVNCDTKSDLEPILFSENTQFGDSLSKYETFLSRPDLRACNRERLVVEASELVNRLLEPFDHVNLFSPAIHNMYAQTASPEKQ